MSRGGIVLIGSPGDVRGFRLAGIEAWPCVHEDDIAEAVRHVVTAQSTPALVLVSSCVFELAPQRFTELEADPVDAMVTVLPPSDDRGRQ